MEPRRELKLTPVGDVTGGCGVKEEEGGRFLPDMLAIT